MTAIKSASGGISRDGSRVANRRTLESAALLSQIQVNLHFVSDAPKPCEMIDEQEDRCVSG
jgi:hypothetical protein